MRIGWGWKITILYGGFVVLIGTLVYKCMHQRFDLVAPDYYEQEVAYQKVIDAGKNQADLSAPVSLYANQEQVTLQFPQEFAGKPISVTVQFYAPANAQMDRKFQSDVSEGKMIFERKELGRTNYQVKISWQSEGKKYFQQTDLNLAS